MNLDPTPELVHTWLGEHPHSSAREVAMGLHVPNDRTVFMVLERLELAGRAQRWQAPNGPWRWEAVTPR